MHNQKPQSLGLNLYTDFWNNNIQKIDSIWHDLEDSMLKLEGRYKNFEPLYLAIEKLTDALFLIFKDFNTIPGLIPISELKKSLNYYRSRYIIGSSDFDKLHAHIMKISEELNDSLADFPEFKRKTGMRTTIGTDSIPMNFNQMPYKWITFKRNDSWFISRYDTVTVYNRNHIKRVHYKNPELAIVKTDELTLKVHDIFGRHKDILEEISHVIAINNNTRCYAATRQGKRIFAPADIVTRILRPYDTPISSDISPGRVRMFGKNHIFIGSKTVTAPDQGALRENCLKSRS